MAPRLISVLRPLAVLGLIISLIWMFLEPGFEPVLALIGSIATLTPLIVVDKPDNSHSSAIHAQPFSGQASTLSPKPSPPTVIYRQNHSDNSPSDNYSLDWLEGLVTNISEWAVIPIVIIGAVIGFIMGVPNGGIQGGVSAVVGAVVGLFAAGAFGYLLQALGLIAVILWWTKYFWLIVGIVVVIGYFVSGRL